MANLVNSLLLNLKLYKSSPVFDSLTLLNAYNSYVDLANNQLDTRSILVPTLGSYTLTAQPEFNGFLVISLQNAVVAPTLTNSSQPSPVPVAPLLTGVFTVPGATTGAGTVDCAVTLNLALYWPSTWVSLVLTNSSATDILADVYTGVITP